MKGQQQDSRRTAEGQQEDSIRIAGVQQEDSRSTTGLPHKRIGDMHRLKA